MNLTQKNTTLIFSVCLLLTLFFSTYKIFYFAPFLIIVYYKRPLITSLWISLICGIILDLLSSEPRLGLNALTFTGATWLLHGQQKHFFADTLSTLPLMTFFFSVTVTVLSLIFHPIPLHADWFFVDLLLLPLMDAAFAFILFILPFLLFGKRRMRGEDYFSQNI